MTREFPKNNPPKNIALPTVGRIVHFWLQGRTEPLPAIVCEVDGSLTVKSICVFTPAPYVEFAVRHTSGAPGGSNYWDWMDYQKGQAAKTEELEKALQGAQGGQQTGLRASPSELETQRIADMLKNSEGG